MSYAEQYPDAMVQFTPFAFSNTGIIKSQTTMKVDTYTLITVPFQFGMNKGVLLGSFSRNEIVFFQRFRGTLATVTLDVQRGDQRQPIKVNARCKLAAVGQMKDKEGIGLIVVEWKPLPPDLEEILGRQLDLVERLKVEAGDFKDRSITVDPTNAKRLGYNNYAVLRVGEAQSKVALFSLTSVRADFLMPMKDPDRSAGEEVGVDLYFLKYRFTVPGKIESAQRLPTGVQRCRVALDFSPELVHILEDYHYSRR